MLPERTIGACRDAAAIFASSAAPESRRADDMRDARLRGEHRHRHRDGGGREIEDAVGMHDRLQRIGGDGHAVLADAGQHAAVAAERGRAVALECRVNTYARLSP